MRKIIAIIVGSSLALQLVPFTVFAVFNEVREAAKQEVQEKREQLKQEVKQSREAVKQEFRSKSRTIREEFKGKSQALREELRKRQEAFREEVAKKREAVAQELKAKREKFKEEEQKRKEELKKKLGEKRAENIERFFQQMVEKFEAAIKRLKDLSDRIASRLNKAEGNGRDVAELRKKLAEANDRVVVVERALEDAKIKYAEAVKDPDFKASFKKVREVVNGVKEKVKEAHSVLVDVVNLVKGLGEGERKATTTSTGQ